MSVLTLPGAAARVTSPPVAAAISPAVKTTPPDASTDHGRLAAAARGETREAIATSAEGDVVAASAAVDALAARGWGDDPAHETRARASDATTRARPRASPRGRAERRPRGRHARAADGETERNESRVVDRRARHRPDCASRHCTIVLEFPHSSGL